MDTQNFEIGRSYSGEQIKESLGPGSYMQVVVLSEAREILCIRFRADLNPNWSSKNELWIHIGDRRIPHAQRWVEIKSSVPIFCGKDRKNNWTYLGRASASILAADDAAAIYTSDENVGLVLKMKFQTSRTIIAPSAASKKRKAA